MKNKIWNAINGIVILNGIESKLIFINKKEKKLLTKIKFMM